MLFEKIAQSLKNTIFYWFWPSLTALQVFGMAWIRHGRRHFVICGLAWWEVLGPTWHTMWLPVPVHPRPGLRPFQTPLSDHSELQMLLLELKLETSNNVTKCLVVEMNNDQIVASKIMPVCSNDAKNYASIIYKGQIQTAPCSPRVGRVFSLYVLRFLESVHILLFV